MTPLALLMAGNPALTTVLIITGGLTLLITGVVLFLLIIPEEDRRHAAASWQRIRAYLLTGSTQRATLMDHEYDGIHELDNRIPPWFSTLFAGTILFAGIYLLNYHILGRGTVMTDEYAVEVAAADLQRRILLASEGAIDENALTLVVKSDALARAGEAFRKNCVSCHGTHGEGVIGPNLTDRYWIHGGSLTDVYRTIKNGVPAKGMISWQLVFTPRQIQELASYVLSFQGTSPVNGKKAEGTLYTPPDTVKAAL